MSDTDLQERLSRHRGFTTKAREVLLEPPAPFAVVAESSGSLSNESTNPKAPHRGFTAKAREMLVERQNSHHGWKSIRTDLDTIRKRQSQLNYLALAELPIQQANIVYGEKEISIPHSKLSRIKAHKFLGETGKTRSANEIFYDKCMKRVRSPRNELQVVSSSTETTTCSDSRRSSSSEKTNKLCDA